MSGFRGGSWEEGVTLGAFREGRGDPSPPDSLPTPSAAPLSPLGAPPSPGVQGVSRGFGRLRRRGGEGAMVMGSAGGSTVAGGAWTKLGR